MGTKIKNDYTILVEKDEDGYYVGSTPALPGCHSQAKSVDQLMERMEEVISLWLEDEHAYGESIKWNLTL